MCKYQKYGNFGGNLVGFIIKHIIHFSAFPKKLIEKCDTSVMGSIILQQKRLQKQFSKIYDKLILSQIHHSKNSLEINVYMYHYYTLMWKCFIIKLI